ncbi:putative neutral zinc metallopeptidase [Methyloglobulus morosus KoM1]|uniref:Putative neutral zinc metallopeptidase n=1 Tax=Methyloglobulus morosus KoM1 TaxID=1116472 RepID=V5C638_9GAMM|nr:neutral zinc metallopeptidase [Methyloglobulus morosus]ESS72218.1 putative neutral zinc metallopeptidase [Methyloglobulus morosus KoM1]
MRQDDGRESENIEDRRSSGLGRGLGSTGFPGGGLGMVAAAVVALLLGVDPRVVINTIGQLSSLAPSQTGGAIQSSPEDERTKKFMSVVLADTEDTWGAIFQQLGRHYEDPKLVLFSGQVESACGYAQSAMGPFYCPGDRKLYLDMSFFNDLSSQYDAPGDFAQAYVVAHEVGHHVQNLLGIASQVQTAQQRAGETRGKQLQVRMELQADCFAGVWANKANQFRKILEPGDLEEALGAASGVGDDRLQKQSQGYVVPESFTHGSSAQRMRWFTVGAQTGDLGQCDTFKANNL